MFVFETVIVAFSMFSAIPMPGIRWNDQNMKYSLCAFPLIGAVIALLMAGAGIVMDLQGFPPLVRGAVFCLTQRTPRPVIRTERRSCRS